MSDFNSQLPVRSRDDIDERVLTKIQDGDDPSGVGKTLSISEGKANVRAGGKDGNGVDTDILTSDQGHVHVALFDSNSNEISEENPLPVFVTESTGDEVDEYDKSVDLAKNASAQHDYTVSGGKNFKGLDFVGTSSGYAKFELQIETGVGTGTFETVATRFNSTANPTARGKYKKRILAGVRIRVEKTNLDNQATDVYSEIKGVES